MPIPVLCPGCSARLNAPDAAAGKNVKCPKCGTLMTIPAADDFEVVDDAPKPPAKKPAAPPPKSATTAKGSVAAATASRKPVKTDVQLDDDDDDRPRRKRARVDDDEDDDDRPRKKRKPQKKVGTNPAVLIGAGVACLVLLGGGGFAIYALTKDKPKDKTADAGGGGGSNDGGGAAGALPAGWVNFTPKNGGFKVNMNAPPFNPDQLAPREPNGKQPRLATYATGGGPTTQVRCEVKACAFPAGMAAADKEKYLADQYEKEAGFVKSIAGDAVKELARGEATVAGKKASEVAVEVDLKKLLAAFEKEAGKAGIPKGEMPPFTKMVVVARWFVADDRGYFLTLTTADARKADLERAFFGSFELVPETAGTEAKPGDAPPPAAGRGGKVYTAGDK